jgi:hypothetical protein
MQVPRAVTPTHQHALAINCSSSSTDTHLAKTNCVVEDMAHGMLVVIVT